MDAKTHWSHIYQTKSSSDVSWYQKKPMLSIELIQGTQVGQQAHVIDVGAGASTLVDHLLALEYPHITLLDISSEALNITRERLGETSSARLQWLVGDITAMELPEQAYDIWHDRAVFHFLTQPLQRSRYIQQVQRAVKPGGHIIIATFATDGPNQCSGLDIVQYDATALHHTFGTDFNLIHSTHETHITPWASEQKFIYCHCQLKKAMPEAV
jgi:ubiquinone/menaquinone biosynthesis C-methylase UbiE